MKGLLLATWRMNDSISVSLVSLILHFDFPFSLFIFYLFPAFFALTSRQFFFLFLSTTSFTLSAITCSYSLEISNLNKTKSTSSCQKLIAIYKLNYGASMFNIFFYHWATFSHHRGLYNYTGMIIVPQKSFSQRAMFEGGIKP